MVARIFAAVALLVLVFVAVQGVPHAVREEVPSGHTNASVPQDFGTIYVDVNGEVAGIIPLVIGVFGTMLVVAKLL